jgi:CRISPR-associated protein Cmr4
MTTTPADADTKEFASKSLYTQQRFLFMTLDPVHIGTGGYRLGRVDMTIAREPGTNLPKIPGTSLAGATRSYAAMRYGKPEAAGQHKKFKGERTQCPIIYTFGTATDTGEGNQAGTVSIGDAQILFFPVNSMIGPVWVSTIEAVEEAWGKERLSLPQGSDSKADSMIANFDWDGDLNLGWLMFPVINGLVITPPDKLKDRLEWSAIRERIALVSLKLFSQIVNSNLEVRTSVSIDPETGAAQEKALFTYEAIPRATWLWCDVVEDDYRKNGLVPVTKQYNNKTGEENKGEDFPEGEKPWKQPLDVARAGMNLIQYLGVGGMGTRGFGRMRNVTDWEVSRGK